MAKFALTAPQLMAPTQSASLAALTEKLVAAETETHLCRLLGQIAGAVRSGDLEAALRRFPVVEGGTLAAVAQAATTTDPSDGPGWAGLTPTLEIIGEARGI